MNYFNKVFDFKEHIPPSVKQALNKIGNQQIVSARCGRTPDQSVIQGALRMVANVPYDNLFHLFIELKLANNQIWVLEKIERINLVREDRSKKEGAEFTSSFSVGKTVNELFHNTRNKMGDRFLPYHSASNNCQVFIIGVLDGNGLNNSERTSFVKQNTKAIFENNPALRQFSNTLTDIGGFGNAMMQGGELHHHFKNNELDNHQLTQLLNHYQIPCNGIYINGKMPTRLKNGNYIINLNGHSHWVALIKHGIEYFYFDSYGVVAPAEVEKKIGTTYIYNHKQLQDLESSSCGWFVIAFLRFMHQPEYKNILFESFVKLFTSDTIKNELVLKTLLR
jgi:hypothetical protein